MEEEEKGLLQYGERDYQNREKASSMRATNVFKLSQTRDFLVQEKENARDDRVWGSEMWRIDASGRWHDLVDNQLYLVFL